MNKGQATAEYIIVIGIVVMAIYAMGPAIKRGTQSLVKSASDQIAAQKDAEQDFSNDSSYVAKSETKSKSNSERTVKERLDTSQTETSETADTTTDETTKLGFSRQ